MWEKVNTEKYSTKTLRDVVLVSPDDVTIAANLISELGLKPGDRVDFVRNGDAHAFEKNDCGVYTLKRQARRSVSLSIGSCELCDYIRDVCKSEKFKARIEENRIVIEAY